MIKRSDLVGLVIRLVCRNTESGFSFLEKEYCDADGRMEEK